VKTTILKSGLAAFIPVAKAIALPCVVCSPSALIYPGSLDEHPIPDELYKYLGDK